MNIITEIQFEIQTLKYIYLLLCQVFVVCESANTICDRHMFTCQLLFLNSQQVLPQIALMCVYIVLGMDFL